MAACPVDLTPLAPSRRRPLALTHRRLEANRRNARSSTGPRTAQGKARVARNAIKHGFFVAQERWTPAQRGDFEETLNGLREDFLPQGVLEESCVQTIAASYVRMASVLRYENIAALKHHQKLDREMSQRIAGAPPPEAARLRAQRNRLQRAGLWRATLPAEREAKAIIRYWGRLDRTIRNAASQLEILKNMRTGGVSRTAKAQKQTHYLASQNSGPSRSPTLEEALQIALRFEAENAKTNPLRASASRDPEALRRTSNTTFEATEDAKTNRCEASPNSVLRLGEGPEVATSLEAKNAKTNPLSSMFTGNRHQRRRARAMTRRR